MSNDPYDPNRPSEPGQPGPPPPPQAPGWGAGPPPPDQGAQPSYGPPAGGQPPSYGQPSYGQPPFGSQPFGSPAGSPPPNYLVHAILATIFCCLPLGIASIVFAAQVNGKYASGDYAGAQEASRKAKQFAIWSAVIGVAGLALYVVFAGLAIFTSS